MDYIAPILLIVGGILAISNLIVAKQPEAKELIDKLVPYQAVIGIALLAVGLINLVRGIGPIFSAFSVVPGASMISLAVIVTSILLGFLFGMPQIAKWMPGQAGAEQKGLELMRKLAPFQVIIGLAGLGAALLWILARFSLL